MNPLIVCTALSLIPSLNASGFEFTSPRGGETWAVGSIHVVSWRSKEGKTDKVRLSYTVNAGKTWKPIGEALASMGKIHWKIPPEVDQQARLRLEVEGTSVTQSQPVAIVASRAKPYRWTEVTNRAAFAPRDGAGALTFREQTFLIGGWNPGDRKHFPRICNNEVWRSRNGLAWNLVKPNTFLDRTFDPVKDWEGRHTAGYAVFKDRMWIIGGDVNQGHYHNDVWNSEDGKTWKLVTREVPWGPRALHYTVAFADHLWVMGGQTVPQFAPEKEIFYNDVWKSADGRVWKKVATQEPMWSPRGMIGGSAVYNNRIWILGGGTYDTPKKPTRSFFNDVWSSADGMRWKRHLAEAPWHPRQYHDVATFDGRLWVMEGYHAKGGNRKDVWYSDDGVNWYEVPNTPWKPRHAASVFVFDDALWMVAGNNMTSDVWKLQPSK